MLTYINILQRCLPNYHKIHYPIDKIQIQQKTIYKINTNYWKNIYQYEINQPKQNTIKILNDTENEEHESETTGTSSYIELSKDGKPIGFPTSELNYDSRKTIVILYYIFIQIITKQINTKVLITNPEILIKEKYRAYKSLVNNIFLTPKMKQEIQTIFERTQRYYFILKRLLKTAIYKRTIITYKITMDLSLQPLDPNNKKTFIVYDIANNTTPPAYLFSVQDLIRIIQIAITNTSNFFETPLSPKNPYTNIEFTEHTLFAIFYKLYKIHHPIPPILIKYYQVQFNKKLFLINNQMEIRDIAIKNFVTNSPSNILYEEIIDMINDNFYNSNIETNIDNDFPRTKLIEIMRPYLYLYLLKQYYINGSDKRYLANKIFKRAVNNFIIYNPRFGMLKQELKPLYKFQPHSNESIHTSNRTLPQNTPNATYSFHSSSASCKKTKQNSSKKTLLFFDDHPKFSMNDIENYFKDPKKLIVLQEPIFPNLTSQEDSEEDSMS